MLVPGNAHGALLFDIRRRNMGQTVVGGRSWYVLGSSDRVSKWSRGRTRAPCHLRHGQTTRPDCTDTMKPAQHDKRSGRAGATGGRPPNGRPGGGRLMGTGHCNRRWSERPASTTSTEGAGKSPRVATTEQPFRCSLTTDGCVLQVHWTQRLWQRYWCFMLKNCQMYPKG